MHLWTNQQIPNNFHLILNSGVSYEDRKVFILISEYGEILAEC